MKTRFVLFIVIGLTLWSFRKAYWVHEDVVEIRYEFALSLIHGPNSQSITFAVVAMRDTNIVKINYLTKAQFINQITGAQKSIANPTDTNLMEVNNIPDCFYYVDSITGKYLGNYCPVLDDLWKVRFKRNPFSANSRLNEGWAQNYYGPSAAQLKFLKEKYRVKNISDLYIGEHMFRFLKDALDTSWVRQYQEAK